MKDFKVIAYYAAWQGMQFEKLDMDILEHVIYAFAIPTEEGTLRELETPQLAKDMIAYVHGKGKTISLAVGGWSYQDIPLEETFVKATNSQEKVERLGNEIVSMCMEYGFDGIDMDWEHPRVKSGTYRQYEALMLYLEQRLHEKGKLLTSAVLSGATWDGQIWEDSAAHTDAVLNAVDWLNVMAYDGGENEKHSTYEFAVNCAKYWMENRKLPRSKMILGLPFYSYSPQGSYEKILKLDYEAYSKDSTMVDGVTYHYNGIDTIERKTEYAVQNCGGVMIWEITEDTTDEKYSLLKAIKRRMAEK